MREKISDTLKIPSHLLYYNYSPYNWNNIFIQFIIIALLGLLSISLSFVKVAFKTVNSKKVYDYFVCNFVIVFLIRFYIPFLLNCFLSWNFLSLASTYSILNFLLSLCTFIFIFFLTIFYFCSNYLIFNLKIN